MNLQDGGSLTISRAIAQTEPLRALSVAAATKESISAKTNSKPCERILAKCKKVLQEATKTRLAEVQIYNLSLISYPEHVALLFSKTRLSQNDIQNICIYIYMGCRAIHTSAWLQRASDRLAQQHHSDRAFLRASAEELMYIYIYIIYIYIYM